MCERYINQSSLTGDMACNPGMRPDWESNQWPFGSQASAQSTEPHQPEHHEIFWLGHPKHSKTRESARWPSEDTEWRHWILEIQDHEWDVVPRKLQDNPFSFSSSFSIVKEPWPSTIILHATQRARRWGPARSQVGSRWRWHRGAPGGSTSSTVLLSNARHPSTSFPSPRQFQLPVRLLVRSILQCVVY